MKITFYAHHQDLDHIDAFLNGTHKEEYEVEVYKNLERTEVGEIYLKSLIQVTVSYAEYVRLQLILKFV